MPLTCPPYPSELKHQIVELVRAGRSPAELAREFEPTAQTIQNWVRQADQAAGFSEMATRLFFPSSTPTSNGRRGEKSQRRLFRC